MHSPAQQAIETASAELPPFSLEHSQLIEQELAATPELSYRVAWLRAYARCRVIPAPANRSGRRVRSERDAYREEKRRRGWRGSVRS